MSRKSEQKTTNSQASSIYNDQPSILNQMQQIRSIQKFVKQNFKKAETLQNKDFRRILIKKFIQNYEQQQKEPIINISQEKRNQYFQEYCVILIQRAHRAHKRHLKIVLRTYDIYKVAAMTIFNKYKSFFAPKSSFLKQKKIFRIQKLLKGIIYQKRFKKLSQQIQILSNNQLTNPGQLIKLLEPNNSSLLESFQQSFIIRFRLYNENNNNYQNKDKDKCNNSLIDLPKPLNQIKNNKKDKNNLNNNQIKKNKIYNPKIYFKIFLRQKVVDLGETAPRNYALELQEGVVDRRLWYVRVTNQPWRRLDGVPLQKDVYVGRPVITQQEADHYKKLKQLKWQQKMRSNYIQNQFQLNQNKEEQEKEKEIMEFIGKIDYFKYENEWKDFGCNLFQGKLDQLYQQFTSNQKQFENEAEERTGSGLEFVQTVEKGELELAQLAENVLK